MMVYSLLSITGLESKKKSTDNKQATDRDHTYNHYLSTVRMVRNSDQYNATTDEMKDFEKYVFNVVEQELLSYEQLFQ